MSRSKEKVYEGIKMNRAINWITYIWLLTVETWEQLIESARWHFLDRDDAATEIRKPQLKDSFRVLPTTAVH
jgi:hypothetical protein